MLLVFGNEKCPICDMHSKYASFICFTGPRKMLETFMLVQIDQHVDIR